MASFFMLAIIFIVRVAFIFFFAVGVLQVIFSYFFCVRLQKLISFVGTTEWFFTASEST